MHVFWQCTQLNRHKRTVYKKKIFKVLCFGHWRLSEWWHMFVLCLGMYKWNITTWGLRIFNVGALVHVCIHLKTADIANRGYHCIILLSSSIICLTWGEVGCINSTTGVDQTDRRSLPVSFSPRKYGLYKTLLFQLKHMTALQPCLLQNSAD